jgi:hypothetical protein
MEAKRFKSVVIITAMLIILSACGNVAKVRQAQPETFQPSNSAQNINMDEAVNVVKNMVQIDYNQYKLNMVDDNFSYNGNQYYQFIISDVSDAIGPSLIVSKHNGAILCYYPDNTVTEVYQDATFKSKC